MAYGSARYNSYQRKKKGVIMSEVQSSSYGQKNTGSTLGYLGGNFAAGLGGIVEGLTDLFLAGGALITGDVDYAKYVFKDNVVGDWHESITDDYSPGKVMQFLGDVSHGLGQSSVFLLDAVGAPVGTVGFFGGMIGQGISSAAEKTGDVGLKEVAYGALSGAAEGVLEKAMGGMSKLATNIASPVVKNVGKTAVRRGLLKQVLSDAASEFGEEFLSEYIDTGLQRLTGVDKNASTSLRDAVYSGFVGAVSGGLSAGAGDVARYSANQRNGAKIIKSGNAQTLVNTAESVADKMAGSGTDFKNAAEWVKTLRAEVDAYNKLVQKGEEKGVKGQTILGEMQASLYFAETQATFSGVLTGIRNADEEKRAALAEYVNLTVDKNKRSKDYTAEDIAKNTDNVAWQLSVLHYVNNIFDIDAAIAQESAIEGVITEEQEITRQKDEAEKSGETNGGNVTKDGGNANERKYTLKKDSSGNTYVDVDKSIVKDSDSPKQIAQTLSDVVRNNFNDFVNVNGQKIGINQRTANEWVKSKDASALLRMDKSKFIDKANAFGNADELLQASKNYIGEAAKHERKDNFAEFARGVVDFKFGDNGYSADVVVGTTKRGVALLYDVVNIQNKKIVANESDTTQNRRHETSATDKSIPQTEPVVNPSGENKSEASEKKYSVATAKRARARIKENEARAERAAKRAQESGEATDSAVESKAKEKGSEAKSEGVEVTTETGTVLKFRDAKEAEDYQAKLARAKRRAEKWRAMDDENAPKVQELNRARQYVKHFDELESNRRLAIINMLRSAEKSGTKIDEGVLRGIANLLAARTPTGRSFAGDLEVRFADGISQDGLYTHADGTPVIVINSKAESTEALRSTVAHELVHYLEKREGYDSLAAFVWQTARAEKKDAIRKEYEDFYKENKIEYTEEDIHSEIVARLVGERLQSEKFLKRYAEKDASTVKRAANFIKGLRKATKDADKEAEAITGEIILRMDRALASADVKESDGGKRYAIDTELLKFYREVSAMTDERAKSKRKKNLGKISSAHAQMVSEVIKKETGKTMDLSGYELWIDGSAIQHIEERHGKNGAKDQSMQDENDISRITWVANHPDTAEVLRNADGSLDWDYRWQNSDQSPSVKVRVSSQIDLTTFYVVECVPDTEKKRLHIESAYIQKNSGKGQQLNIESEDSPQHTSKTLIDSNATNKSIPQIQELSTPSEKKYSLSKKTKERMEQDDPYFDTAMEKMYQGEVDELRKENKSLAQQIALDAYETDAKIFTQKEIDALVDRINAYSTDRFKDVMNEKDAKLSKADKEQFAYDIYVAFHVASGDKRAMDRMGVLADRLARKYLDDVYYTDKGKRVYLKEMVDEDTYKQYVRIFKGKIIASFKQMGRETTHAKLTANYRAEMAKLQKQLLDSEEKGKNLRELQWQAKKLRTDVDIQKRSPQDEGIYNVEKEMSRIADERGRVSAKQADKAFEQMHVFLTSDSGKVDSALDDLLEVEGESLISLIEEYKHSREKSKGKYLSSKEMALAAKIIAGGRKILREYNREYYNGHWVNRLELATEAVKDYKSFAAAKKEYKTKAGAWLGEKLRGLNQTYFYNVLSPETVVDALEGFNKNGVLKKLYHAVREATQKAEHMAVQMKTPFAEYMKDKENAWQDGDGKKHSFGDKLNLKTVVVNGNEITLGEAIYLLMLTKREHSHLGLKEGGFITYDENNQKKLQFKILDIDAAAGQIFNQLDATDKKFLEMAEKFFNETASKIKYDADMKILGYTNNQEGYYVPIIRDRYSRMEKVTDKRQSIASIATVDNKSFTKNLVQNAKELEGKNIMAIINDHADGLADYSELYLPLKSFDRVYNTRVITETAQATSIRDVLNNEVWKGTDGYFKKLFADIQGQGEARDTLDQVVGKLRSGWVNSVLGLNLKVVATQTTSFVAANQVIEMKYLAPALSKFVGDASELGARADQYSDIIEARSFEMGALRAQGNIDKVAKWAEKSGFMINWMDRRVCLAIFHAAELKAEAQGAGAVGTVENAQAAAKIADEVIYTTQAMTSQAERSALQRHKSEIAKMFAMFTSDSVKQLSHFYGNAMRYFAHKERAKTDASYAAELKKDAKAVGRSATTLVMTGVMLGLITQGFKYLYAQEEEPEERAKDFAIDMVSSTLNILPVVSDVMDKFVFGYDLSLNVLDIANDTIEDTSKLFSMAGKAMSGEFVSNGEVGKNVIGAVKTYATLLGVPISPVERTVTGLMRRFTPSTVYGYDAMFSNPSYTSDLKDAVESGDERLAEHILTQLYKSEATGVYTSEELEEVARLYGAGYESVLPQKVSEEVNGVTLTRAQRRQFEKIYSQASGAVNEMMATEGFRELSDEGKAKAIKNLYTLYYNRASAEVAGAEWSNAQAYSHLTEDVGALFVAQAYKNGLTAYEGEDGGQVTVKEQVGAYVQNLALSEGEQTVMLYALGYRDKTTTAALVAHINSLNLSDEDKAKIAERLGFSIKNGAVTEKAE